MMSYSSCQKASITVIATREQTVQFTLTTAVVVFLVMLFLNMTLKLLLKRLNIVPGLLNLLTLCETNRLMFIFQIICLMFSLRTTVHVP